MLNITRNAPRGRKARYSFLRRWVIVVTSMVALAPLFILTFMNYFQYQHVLKEEVKERVHHMTSSTKRSLEFFLSERRSALSFTSREKTFEELSNQEHLVTIFKNLQDVLGDIVDLGFIDNDGKQISYIGPYELLGKDYSAQDWFHEVKIRGYYVSDVFLGYREFPHFVIAVAKKGVNGESFVLRATIDSEILVRQLRSLEIPLPSEAFIINRQGILQTPSMKYGKILTKIKLKVPVYTEQWKVEEIRNGFKNYIFGYAYVNQSPFILIIIKHPHNYMANWFSLRRNLWLFLVFSSIVILAIIILVAYYMVARIREADSGRALILHKVEYQNKMASLGRLAAGVAHEINNPLAIINEKAGMIKDLSNLSKAYPNKEKCLNLTDSILKSVERCSRITRRLLGFAKHIDVKIEPIDMEGLIRDVNGFLDHEAKYRNIRVKIMKPEDDLPPIHSDRGQLEQVFLNMLNNSLNALSESERENGEINISINEEDADHLAVTVSDNGPGISQENLSHVFEPFFTTRSEGTGLGLSITYGIVEKLGGRIDVESQPGVGTSFKVILPIQGV